MSGLYELSSQHREWKYDKEALEEKRKELNSLASMNVTAKSSELEYLFMEEEELLCSFYQSKIQDICKFHNFPLNIFGTAVLFHKRFYLSYPMLQFDPKHVMLTCVFLAAKVENNHLQLGDFVKKIPNVNQNLILELEFHVCKGLRFHFHIHLPYLPLYGFYLESQRFIKEEVVHLLKDAYEAALKYISMGLLTDAPLLFTPSQIALSAFLHSCHQLNISLEE